MIKYHWTDEMVETLDRLYPDTFNREIADLLGVSYYAVSQKGKERGLKKSHEIWVKSGKMSSELPNSQKTRFKKGQPSIKKGKHVSPETYEKCKATMFKKGTVPPNHKPVGTERISKDGYVEVKVAEGMRQWRLKHRVLWESVNGNIPDGMILYFKNGDKQDIRIENLGLISRTERMYKNSIHRLPEELFSTIMAIGRLNRQIHKHEK